MRQLSKKLAAVERKLPRTRVDLREVSPRDLECAEVFLALAIVMDVPHDVVWADVGQRFPDIRAAYEKTGRRPRSDQGRYIQNAPQSGFRLAHEILSGVLPQDLTRIIQELQRKSRSKRLPTAASWLSRTQLSRLPGLLRE